MKSAAKGKMVMFIQNKQKGKMGNVLENNNELYCQKHKLQNSDL